MTRKIRHTFLKEYGIWEYVVFGIGLIFLGRVAYEVIVLDFKEATWVYIGVLVLFLSLGILSIAAPKSIVSFARKRVGMEVKNKKDAVQDN